MATGCCEEGDCVWSMGGRVGSSHVMVKMDPPKLVPPGTNFLINKDPPGT